MFGVDLVECRRTSGARRRTFRAKAVGLHLRGSRLLTTKVRDATGGLKGVCPLGGGVEFLERWPEALLREFREELGIEVTVKDHPSSSRKSTFTTVRHEVVVVDEVGFPAGAFAGKDHVLFTEGNGTCVARWYDSIELDRDGGPRLYPDGLGTLLWSIRDRAEAAGNANHRPRYRRPGPIRSRG